MKHKFIYILLFAFFYLGETSAQFTCTNFFDVDLDENGEGQLLASDLVDDIEFYIANGTLTYYLWSFNSGVFNSGSDVIQLTCDNAGVRQYIIEYTVDGELIETCIGTINIFDPTNSCPEPPVFCDDVDTDCNDAIGGKSILSFTSNTIPAEDFALCSNFLDCQGTYKVAIGYVFNATNLVYNEFLMSTDIVDYKTPVVLSYNENGGTQFDQSYLYVWENLACFIVPKSSVTIALDLTAETTIVPSMFLHEDNTCSNVTIAVTEINGDEPTDFFDDVMLDCDDVGYQTVYLKDAETGFIVNSQLFLSDPLETCGPILGPGDRLIEMSNNPPVGTYANTKISVNGVDLLSSAAGKGWIINEDMLVDGTNTLNFDSGPFILNGVSTLDLVRLLRVIILDEYDYPMQSIVMDVDDSGYNGIGDLLLIRKLILGHTVIEDVTNVLFKSKELQFPADFNPFSFDYDFTTYDFEKEDFDNLSFKFEAHKVGDYSGNAVVEDSLVNEVIASTRDFDVFEVSNMEVSAGVPFNFSLIYDKGVAIKGLLAALVSTGVKFETLTSQQGNEVTYNVIDDNEIRISYLASDPLESIESISFQISAVSSQSGDLIDLLALKSGFPQEVVNNDDEVIDIENIEESTATAIEDLDAVLNVSIYPNPTSHRLVILSSEAHIGQVEISDPMGKKILSGSADSKEIQFDVSTLASGLYYIKIENIQGIINKSFIKN